MKLIQNEERERERERGKRVEDGYIDRERDLEIKRDEERDCLSFKCITVCLV